MGTEPSSSSQDAICLASLSTTALVGQPSCIAFSPDHRDLFVIGTYQLDQKSELSNDHSQATDGDEGQSQSRSGTVQLFRLEESRQITGIQTHDLTSTASHSTQDARPFGAVLDLRFSTSPRYQNTFAVCTSTGLIILFRLITYEQQSSHFPVLELTQIFTPFTAETLLTSLSWDPHPSSPDKADLAVTLSDGRIAVLTLPLSKDLNPNAEIQYIQTLHSESAWTAQWCPPPTQSSQRTITTGGDDGTIHTITLPTNPPPNKDPYSSTNLQAEAEKDAEQALHAIDLHTSHRTPPPSLTHQYDDRTHTAGVTAILPLTTLALSANILATGSYDNHIRILRPSVSSRRWETLAEMDLGGGVWKLELLCSRNTTSSNSSSSSSSITKRENDEMDGMRWLVLASCMHAGVRVVEVQCFVCSGGVEETWGVDILACFAEHTSMCYASAAAAAARLDQQSDRQMWQVVSTSFYDCMVCVWEFEWIRKKHSDTQRLNKTVNS